uniref:VASP tetramerisation domain-containing protein n=1 Tax=Canis lupus familiaris TaxID=9615 RepID=A0A8C0S246_CANLF
MSSLLSRLHLWPGAHSQEPCSSSLILGGGRGSGGDGAWGALGLDQMEQEILEEEVRELHKVEEDIIDAIGRSSGDQHLGTAWPPDAGLRPGPEGLRVKV